MQRKSKASYPRWTRLPIPVLHGICEDDPACAIRHRFQGIGKFDPKSCLVSTDLPLDPGAYQADDIDTVAGTEEITKPTHILEFSVDFFFNSPPLLW